MLPATGTEAGQLVELGALSPSLGWFTAGHRHHWPRTVGYSKVAPLGQGAQRTARTLAIRSLRDRALCERLCLACLAPRGSSTFPTFSSIMGKVCHTSALSLGLNCLLLLRVQNFY